MSLARKITLNASALAGSRMSSAALGIVSVGISTRYLGIDAFGALAAALAFSSLLNLITDAGIWTVSTREIAKRPEQTQRIFGTTLTLGLGLSVLGAAVGVAVALVIYGGEGDALTRKGVLLMLLTVPLAAPFGAVTAYFISEQRAWIGALGSSTSSVVQLLGLIAVTTLDWGFTAVVGAYVVAALAQVAVVFLVARGKVRVRPAWDRDEMRRLLRSALPLSGATIVHSLYWRIDIVLLSVLASSRELGLYGLSYRVVDALVALPAFVLITLLPEYARLAEAHDRLREIAQKALTVMQVAALGLLAIFVGFAREVVEVVGGPGFADAAPVLQVLIIGVALNYGSAVLAQVLVAVNREVRLFKMSLALLPANVVLNLVLIPLWGALGAAVAFAVSELLHLGLLALIYRGYGRLPRPQRSLQMFAAAALTGLVACAKLLPFLDDLAPVVVLLAGIPLAIATYVGGLYALGAMPREIHLNLVLPAWRRLRPVRAG